MVGQLQQIVELKDLKLRLEKIVNLLRDYPTHNFDEFLQLINSVHFK